MFLDIFRTKWKFPTIACRTRRWWSCFRKPACWIIPLPVPVLKTRLCIRPRLTPTMQIQTSTSVSVTTNWTTTKRIHFCITKQVCEPTLRIHNSKPHLRWYIWHVYNDGNPEGPGKIEIPFCITKQVCKQTLIISFFDPNDSFASYSVNAIVIYLILVNSVEKIRYNYQQQIPTMLTMVDRYDMCIMMVTLKVQLQLKFDLS